MKTDSTHRVLKIVSGYDEGGVLSCEAQFTRILRDKGVQVDMVIVGNGKRRALYEETCRRSMVIDCPQTQYTGNVLTRLYNLVKTLLWGRKQARVIAEHLAESYDTVIYRRESFMFLAGYLARRLKAGCYWHISTPVGSGFARCVYHLSSLVFKIVPLANSEYTRATVGAYCKHIVYPGFYKERLLTDTGKSEFTFEHKPEEPVFGMLARICDEKAQDILIRGFLQSGAIETHGAHLILGGIVQPQDYLDEIRAAAGDQWGKHIHYIGLVSNVNRFYQAVDVIFNSRRNAEAFGISIAEAIFMKKPVIAYYLGGPSEMIKDGGNGWLVRGKTPADYAEAIRKSLEQRENWPQIGEQGYRDSKKFDAEENVNKLIAIIAGQTRRGGECADGE